jgi:hypothetical protein
MDKSASMRWLKSSTPVIPMQTGMAEVPIVLTGPRLFLRSDDRHAGIKKDEQQHEAAHKSPEGHTYQRLPEPHGPHDARGLPHCDQRYRQRNPCYRVSCQECCCHLTTWYLVAQASPASDGGVTGLPAHHGGGVRGAGAPGTHQYIITYAPSCLGGSCAEGRSANHCV